MSAFAIHTPIRPGGTLRVKAGSNGSETEVAHTTETGNPLRCVD
jgi:hypothetical protein